MRIGTLRHDGRRLPILLEGDRLVELDRPLKQLLGEEDLAGAVTAARTSRSHPLASADLGPAIPDPGKILCVGLNYADHAAEIGARAKPRPEIFMRALTSLSGPNDPILIPRASRSLDYEVELAVVIGAPGRYVPEERALSHVAGYAVFNDYSVRDFQSFGTQWIPGKNFDRSGPLGPFIVTADEVSEPGNLDITLVIQGPGGAEETMQSSNTRLMLHSIEQVIAYCSLWTTLEAGDVIATGTPSGVGLGRDPKRWLLAGETVISRVAGVGELKNQVLEDGGETP